MILLLSLLAFSANAAKFSSKNGRFFIDCKVESHKEICHLDTGAFSTRVRAVNGIEKYPSKGKTKSKGVSGEVLQSDLVAIKSIRAEELQQKKIIAATVPETFPYSVLGIEFFKSFKKITFDFDTLNISKKLLPAKHLCPSKINLNNELIQLEVKLADKMLFAAFDTGASISVVNKTLIEANPALFSYVRDIANGQDSNGKKVPVKMYRIKSLGLCGMDYQDVDMVAVDLSASKKEMPEFPDMFLGANLMVGNLWSFDFENKRWYLQ